MRRASYIGRGETPEEGPVAVRVPFQNWSGRVSRNSFPLEVEDWGYEKFKVGITYKCLDRNN